MIGVDVWSGTSSQVQNYAHGTGRNVTYPIGMNGGNVGAQWGLDRSSFVIVDANGIIQFISPQSTFYYQRLSRYESEMMAKLDELLAMTGVDRPAGEGPVSFALHPNAPNPFAVSTTMRFTLGPESKSSTVRLVIHDLLGRPVRTLVEGRLGPGSHSGRWDGRDPRGKLLPAGVYFYVLTAGTQRAVRRLVYLPR